MNIEDYYHYYQLNYQLTPHYLKYSKTNYCNYCVANYAFFTDKLYPLFKLWINKHKEKNKINILIQKIKSSCACYTDTKGNVDDFKKILKYFVTFLNVKTSVNLWEYNYDFFIKSLSDTKLTQYKNTFNDRFIFCFYDLNFKQDIKKYLIETIKMKIGHATRLIRYYECRLKSK